jgi:hypothetical protein
MQLQDVISMKPSRGLDKRWILIDREVDMISALRLQRTYIGMIDELFGMRYGK